MSSVGVTGGDAAFDLRTVDGQTCYVRLTAHGLLTGFVVVKDLEICMSQAMILLSSILDTLSIPLLIDCDSATGRCYSVDVCSERVYTSGTGGLPRTEHTR